MLKDILENKKCFKLVCGAGNEDAKEVERLVALYSKAGCNFFDLCAKEEIIEAAQKGLNYSIAKENQKNFFFCLSVGIKGDPHVSKAQISETNCISCGSCSNICPQNAIFQHLNSYDVEKTSCIGCGKCANICPANAISFYSESKDFKEVLPPLLKPENRIDCIEFHAITEDENEIMNKWNDINFCYEGILSICIDRSKLGDEKLLNRVKKMIKKRAPYSTIIQADGAPMSGNEDDYKTTLQSVAVAEIFQNANLPVYILLSGGTNSKTTELARLCGIKANGVAIGSYARKIVRKYIERDDFFTNPNVFNEALAIAQKLVEKSLNNLR